MTDRPYFEEARRGVINLLDILTNGCNPKLKPCNLMFYGIGEVAESAVSFIEAAHEEFRGKLGKIFIIGNNEKEEEEITKSSSKLEWLTKDHKPISPSIPVIPLKGDELQEYLNDTDIFLLTANSAPKEERNRLEICRYNLSLIDKIKPLLKGFQGHVHIVTNLPEVLSYKLASESDLSPYQISGSSHIDKKRLDLAIIQHFKDHGIGIKRTQAFCVGYHDNPWPVLNNMMIDTGNGFENLEEKINPELQMIFYDFIKEYGIKQKILAERAELNRSPTPKQTGEAIKEFILNYIIRSGITNASVFLENLYLEAPTYLEQGFSLPNLTLLKRMTKEEDIPQFEKRKRDLGDILDRFNLRSNSRLRHMPTKYGYTDPSISLTYHLPARKDVITNETMVEIRTEPEIKKPVELEGTIYYISSNVPLVVQALDLLEGDINKQRKFKVSVKDQKYDDKISLGKILLNQDRIFVHGTYQHRDEKKGHLVWFNSKEAQKNGHIKPVGEQEFEIDGSPITNLYLPHTLMDTTEFYKGKMYFIIKEQEKGRVVVFDPENPPDYKVISKGIEGDEALLSIAAVNEDLIFAGNKNIYRLHKDRFKKICQAECNPRFIRSLYDSRVIMYSDGEKSEAWYFELDSIDKHMRISEGPYFEISQEDKIVLASNIHEKIQRIEYNGLYDFKSGKPDEVKFSRSLPCLKRVIMLNDQFLFGVAQEESNAKIYSLNQGLEDLKNIITLPSTSYLKIEAQNE